jgi:hypothetical protein
MVNLWFKQVGFDTCRCEVFERDGSLGTYTCIVRQCRLSPGTALTILACKRLAGLFISGLSISRKRYCDRWTLDDFIPCPSLPHSIIQAHTLHNLSFSAPRYIIQISYNRLILSFEIGIAFVVLRMSEETNQRYRCSPCALDSPGMKICG